MFKLYLELGFDHILDFNGLDHVLYVIALAALFHYREWKHILVLITAFTIGHSLTLALSTFDYVTLSGVWTEFLIVLTILLTAVFNLFDQRKESSRRLRYLSALLFGLIHGLGFSFLIRQSLMSVEESILLPLLSFNLGLEMGQILVIIGLFAVQFLIHFINGQLPKPFLEKSIMNWWTRIISILVIIYILPIFLERIQTLINA